MVADYRAVKYAAVAEQARLVVDTPGGVGGLAGRAMVIGLSGTRQGEPTDVPELARSGSSLL